MNEFIKILIEIFAISLIWIAVDYKRKVKFKAFKDKEWWIQFLLIVAGFVIFDYINYK
jgi:hypothetical protein